MARAPSAQSPPRLTALADVYSLSACSILKLFRNIISFPREPERQLWRANTIPERYANESALQGTYLERESIHVGIQLCTRVYTIVYPRVYNLPPGRGCRLALPPLKTQIYLSSALCPRALRPSAP